MSGTTEHVVLLDRLGLPAGTVAKHAVHSPETPLHLAFSCYVVDREGRVLLTRRARSKRTWPGVWTNACCGHPQDGESLRAAVTRRLRDELGVRPSRVDVLLPDFAYRAEMEDGTVEHELCPVLVAEVDAVPDPDPVEVEEVSWIRWPELLERARREPASLSPWSVEQVHALAALGWQPGEAPGPDGLLDAVPLTALARPVVADTDPLAPVEGPLRDVVAAFLDEKAAELLDIDPALAPVAQEIRGLVDAGGKRLRPAFVHWGHRAVTDRPSTGVLHVGAAVELLHTFALLHDDVMDRAARRRGRPAAHVTFRAHHEGSGLLGDSGWFGTSAAVLAGDLAFVWADELLERSGLPADARDRVRRVFTTLRSEVMAGQYLDLLHGADPHADEPGARRVALLKSARYTVTRPLQLGAAAADAADAHGQVHAALAAYGDAVGFAFQLRDDVLGLFGDPAETGKSALDDLREGKRTLLVLRARRLADARQRRILDDALGDPTVDEARADAVRAVVADTGALASIELLISHEHAAALRALDAVGEPARGALGALASRATRRDR